MLKWVSILLTVLMMSCASHPRTSHPGIEAQDDSMQSITAESSANVKTKSEYIQDMEREMRLLLGWAMERFEDLQKRLTETLKPIIAPPKIQAVEKELADFYSAQDAEYEKQVTEITERYEQELEGILNYLRPRVWEVAFSVTGSSNVGQGTGQSTGIPEVDEIATATLDLIDFRSGVDEVRDIGQHARITRLFMDRIYKNEVEGQGRFSLFVSDPVRHYFRRDEDAIGVTVTYQRKGLDPSIPLELRQMVRNRIVRGGMTRFSTEFEPDRNLGSDLGLLRLESGIDAPVVVSTVFYPRVNMDHPYFDRLHDFTAIRDYKTAVVNAKTGEVIDCVSWQYLWHISHYGAVAVEKGHSPLRDEEAVEIKALLAGNPR
ncbi:MAG: hypothetical protein KJ645_05140 [Planctomycetes bacterium]|nr:hypothetical protein [Planctomycetota bacterium]